MSRFFVQPQQVGEEEIEINNNNDISHMINVLRLKKGDLINISDSTDWEYRAEIVDISPNQIITKILDKQHFSREPALKITLFQSLPKQKKMDEIIQKSIELGVNEIVPIFTSRSLIDPKTDFKKKVERWNRISAETVKQCQRGHIPKVELPLTFEQLLKYLVAYDLVLFPYENESGLSIKTCLRHLNTDPEKIGIIIGPEGGFSDMEAQTLKDSSAHSVSLGKTILRTETAGPAAIAMTMYELELD